MIYQKPSICELCPSPMRTIRNINSNVQWDRNPVYSYAILTVLVQSHQKHKEIDLGYTSEM